jgi:hypothetical protein
LGKFRVFTKNRRDIRNFVFIGGVNNMGYKLFTGVNNTGDICIIFGVVVTGDETHAEKSTCLHLKVNIKVKNHYMSVNSNITAS